MCGFRVGDEVVYVGSDGIPRLPEHERFGRLKRGDIVTVSVVAPWRETDLIAIILKEYPGIWFDARCFRKVQRRDISAWLETAAKDTEHLDRRAPAKEPV